MADEARMRDRQRLAWATPSVGQTAGGSNPRLSGLRAEKPVQTG